MPKDNLNHYRQDKFREEAEKLLYKHVTSFQAVSYEDLTDALVELHKQSVLELPEMVGELTRFDKRPDDEFNLKVIARNQLRQEIRERVE